MCLGVLRHHNVFGGYISNRVDRLLCPNGIRGLYATELIEEDSLLACIPSFAAVCPASALATEVGRTMYARLNPEGYYRKNDIAELRISRDTFLVAGMTALQLQRGPLATYLRDIVVERESDESLKEAFIGNKELRDNKNVIKLVDQTGDNQREQQWKHFLALRELADDILKEAHGDMMGLPSSPTGTPCLEDSSLSSTSSSPVFTVEELYHANAICESRVVSIPGKVDVFQGPALVPWFDLINHDDQDPLVYAEVMERSDLPEKLRKISPFCVVGVATRDIQSGEHITYQYADPIVPGCENYNEEKAKTRLMWAMRFHYVPAALRE